MNTLGALKDAMRLADRGTPVRWRQGRGGWRYGHLNGQRTEADGSIRVYDNYSGAARSIPATAVQIEARGPRGGRCWAWMDGHTDPDPAPERPAWNPPPGKAELLNQDRLFDLGAEP